MSSNEGDRARWLVREAERKVFRQREIVAALTQRGLSRSKALKMMADLQKALARCQLQIKKQVD